MYCPRCRGEVESYQRSYSGPNHMLHALLTFFMCGLWLPIWIAVALLDGGQRSGAHCGRCHIRLG